MRIEQSEFLKPQLEGAFLLLEATADFLLCPNSHFPWNLCTDNVFAHIGRLGVVSEFTLKNGSGCRGKSDPEYSDLGDGKQTAIVMSLCFSPMDLCAILVLFFKAVHYSVHFTHQPLPDARSAAPSFTFLAHKCTDIHVFFLWIDIPF